MKKMHHTTSGTLSMKWIAGGVWAFVFFVAVLLCIVLRLAWSQGGGIEAEVRGHGIARQVQCARDGAALWMGWTCRVGEIIWGGVLKCMLINGGQTKSNGDTVYLRCGSSKYHLLSPLPWAEYKAKRQIRQ